MSRDSLIRAAQSHLGTSASVTTGVTNHMTRHPAARSDFADASRSRLLPHQRHRTPAGFGTVGVGDGFGYCGGMAPDTCRVIKKS